MGVEQIAERPGLADEAARVPRPVLVVVGATFLASVAWTLLHRDDLAELRHRLDRLAVIAVAIVVAGCCTVVGLAILLVRSGPRVLRQVVGPVGDRELRHLPRRARAALEATADDAHDRWFLVGWAVNSIGGLTPSFVLTLGVFWVLPAGSWGLATVPGIDFAVSLALRLAIHRRILRARRPAQVGP